jgi:hypothetical protein
MRLLTVMKDCHFKSVNFLASEQLTWSKLKLRSAEKSFVIDLRSLTFPRQRVFEFSFSSPAQDNTMSAGRNPMDKYLTVYTSFIDNV